MQSGTRFYRGHRIRVVDLDGSWITVIYSHTGDLVDSEPSNSLAEALALGEWLVERRLRFRPPARGEQAA